jgi:hypothetical protein
MSLVNKTLGVVSFLLFFCLALLSSSFTSSEDSASVLGYQPVTASYELKHEGLRAEGKNLEGGVLLEDEGILPKPARDLLAQAPQSTATAAAISEIRSGSSAAFAFKSPVLDLSPVLNL